ncbi:hypothetical protein GCM10007205_00900 [Oxalicibacterium flavum]|uniref:DUF3739 domain-containing protein n=1 Tax=Oxalicibacterium flavum TaxID=179467 RepID=A0A8J2UKJ0_9BURK|nr:hypothetical protein GCM10007205_00900 [Oxalicibacterium flavum]
MYGKVVNVQRDAGVWAPAGDIDVHTASIPIVMQQNRSADVTPKSDGNRIYLDSGAFLSVGGLRDVPVPTERNFIQAEFRINELRDSLLNREGWLRGQKVVVDRRKAGMFTDGPMAGVKWVDGEEGAWVGTRLGDMTGWLGVGKTDLQELSTQGGSISLVTRNGDVITRSGALLDVSGGSVRYTGGYDTSTMLRTASGRIYNIGSAPENEIYVGLAGQYVLENARWGVTERYASPLMAGKRYESGYTEGRDAGDIVIKAGRNLILEGDLWGGVTTGDRQAAQEVPHTGGSLTIGGSMSQDFTWSLGRLFISAAPRLLPKDFAFDSPELADWFRYLSGTETGDRDGRIKQTWLSDAMLGASGLGEFNFYVTDASAIEAGTRLELSPGASFTLGQVEGAGPDILVAGVLRAPGGVIGVGTDGRVTLAATGRVDVAGEWRNGLQDGLPARALAADGGQAQILAGELRAEAGSAIDVSGGGQVYGKNGRPVLSVGDAGRVMLWGVSDESGLENVSLHAYAAGSGGALELTVNSNVQIGGALAQDGTDTLLLPAGLYGERGFRSLTVEAQGHDIIVPEGVTARQQAHVVNLTPEDYVQASTGTSLAELGSIGHAPSDERLARATGGLWLYGQQIDVAAGATLATDLGGTLKMAGSPAGGMHGEVNVRGTLEAPAGRIDIESQSLSLHSGASLLARGESMIDDTGARGRQGRVLAGGQIVLQAESLNLARGALVDVSGSSGWIDVPSGGLFARGDLQAVRVDSNGGRIEIKGNGIVESTLLAAAGGPGAMGGSLLFGYTSSAPVGGGNSASQILDFLKFLDPDCNGLGDWANCTMTDPYKAVGWDIDAVFYWGTPIVLSREFVDLVVAAAAGGSTSQFVLSDSHPLPAAGTGPLNPGNYGLSDAVLDLFRDNYFGSDIMRDVFVPPHDASLIVRASAFARGGFADLTLRSTEDMPIRIDPASLVMGRSISLDGRIASTGEGAVTLRAPVIRLSGSMAEQPVADGLAGSLSLEAELIDIEGLAFGKAHGARISGYAETLMQARDIRLGTLPGERVSVDVDGALTLRAGQIYPGTAVQATVRAATTLRTERLGDAVAPLSAGGTLVLAAPEIVQAGVLRAPFGQITLAASHSLILEAGSVTSVAGGSHTVPYGALSNGEYWLDPTQYQMQGINPADYRLAAPPEKRIVMESPEVVLAEGAQVDISGGGDLYASEFVPGPGGSHDVLALPGMHAVLPGYAGVSPVAGVDAGRQVWLSGGDGLASGWYTLLPAQYALLPGAYAVQDTGRGQLHVSAPGGTDSVRYTDGSLSMHGRERNAVDGSQQAFGSSWRVMPGSVVRGYTEYNEAGANAFFSSEVFKLTQSRYIGQMPVTPRLPRDGGAVVFKAGERLVLDGSLHSQAASGGLGGLVDIAGEKIAIVGAGLEADALRADGYLVVDAGSLTGFGAGSLLVGGTRSGDPLGMRVDVTATHIVVRNDADSVLSGAEIILAAADELIVDADSRIAVREGSGASQGDLVVAPQRQAVYTDPDGNLDDNWDGVIDEKDAADDVLTAPAADWGALLRVSNAAASRVVRQGVDTTLGGRVSVGANARIEGGAALLIDATRTTDLAASAVLSGTDLSVSSGRIGFGGGSDGMVLDQATLTQLSRSRQLTLRSYSDFDFHRSVDLTGAGLHTVVLDGARLVGHGGHDVRIDGSTVVLRNTAATATGAIVAAGSGTLALNADELVLGEGDKAIAGFAAVMLQGARQIVGEGRGALDAGSSAVTLNTPLLTGRGGASQSLGTQGALQVLSDAGVQTPVSADSLGSSLALSGGSVVFGGHAAMQGGTVSLTATAGDLVLTDAARIDVGGLARAMFDQIEYADAGRVDLSSLGGDVRLQNGSVIDLAAQAGGGDAGQLSVTAEDGGAVTLDGVIHAQAGKGGLAGAFNLDIDALSDFGVLAARLDEAGFTRARHFRVRQGNVVLDGATAAQDFVLMADHGKVTVQGVVDARAPYGGSIRISGGNGIAVGAQAQLLAGSTGELGSGRVTLDAVGGRLEAAAGLIDVGGGEQGVVRLRAQRNAANSDVAADPLGVQVRGARLAVLEGTRTYDSASVDAIKAQVVSEGQDFANRAVAIAARVGSGWTVAPGIEIRSSGDLDMASDWNLWTDFSGARAGSLTLRAAGNLKLLGHLSDGFDAADRSGLLQTGDSWGLRLVAGADLGAADALALRPQALLAADQGTITVGTADSSEGAGDGAGYLVRTGTGDLVVRAGRDLDLAHKESVIYTAGRHDTTTWSDFSTAAPDAVYAVNGGHLDIAAQGSIRARPAGQRFVEWLKRQGNVGADGYFGPYDGGRIRNIPEPPFYEIVYEDPEQSSWWVNHGGFEQGVGALGGGNVTISAGGDLDNLVVVQPTNMRMRGGRSATEAMRMEVRNGGVMTVDAGGAILGGQYYVARGEGRISADRTDIGHRVLVTKDVIRKEFDIAPVLAVGDAQLRVRTAGDLKVQTLIDPLLVRNGWDGRGTWTDPLQNLGAHMSGYTARTALALSSVSGDVTLVNQGEFVFRDVALQSWTTEVDNLAGAGGNLYPARSRVVALSGSVGIQGPMFVMPGERQELAVLAQQDLRFVDRDSVVLQNILSNYSTYVPEIVMARVRPDAVPTPYRPRYTDYGTLNSLLRHLPPYYSYTDDPATLPLVDDFEPARLYAAQGSITELKLYAAKQTWMRAGRDIRNFSVEARNLRSGDTTWMDAGSDIVTMLMPLQQFRSSPSLVRVEGPGLMLMTAGRDVYANEMMVQTLGHQEYDSNNRPVPDSQISGLSTQGAAITIMAGLNRDVAYDAFARAYLDPANVAAMPDYLQSTVDGALLPAYLTDATETRRDDFEKTVRRGLVSYVAEITGETLAPLAAWERFNRLPELTRQQFVRRVFLQELRDAGRDQNYPGQDGLPRNGGYNRGYAAIDTLFPGDGWKGDVMATSLWLRTQAGGDIQVLTPGGGLQVAALGATVLEGAGLVTLASGHINLFAHDDVTVNRSRVLSFVPEAARQGSDQIVWSSQGDIDAGRGAKTVRVPSSPDVVTDEDGNTLILERSDMSGSGIGTVGEGDVDLVAPEGTVNFGDAGVRVAGNFNVAALQVLNAANIEVQGEATGLPVVASVNVGALTDASAAASSAATAAQDMLQRDRNTARQNLPSIFTVRVLGFGSEPEEGAARPTPERGAGYDSGSAFQVLGQGDLPPSRMARLTATERENMKK